MVLNFLPNVLMNVIVFSPRRKEGSTQFYQPYHLALVVHAIMFIAISNQIRCLLCKMLQRSLSHPAAYCSQPSVDLAGR
jgi:hypothetical protein